MELMRSEGKEGLARILEKSDPLAQAARENKKITFSDYKIFYIMI